MSLQIPLRHWALRPLNSKIASCPSISNSFLSVRRPFLLVHAQRQLFHNQKQSPLLRTLQKSQLQNTAFHAHFRRTFHTSGPRSINNKSSGPGYTYQAPNATPSLSQRLKALSREYGWSALWIYLFLSALDFPFCFAAVKLLGADKVGHYEHVLVENVKGAVNKVWPGAFEKSEEKNEEDKDAEAQAAEKKKKKGPAEEASLWTQLALAYAIHKSFIFVRVPLTAAITPKVVKQLRKWGWDVLKGKPKAK